MLENFALLKEKITSSFLVHYLLPRPLLLVTQQIINQI